jgi:Glycosyltransferase sugar-binding region containing DXD motif
LVHTFQSFWWGGTLSPYERLSINSFVSRGFGYDLYTFDAYLEVPLGVRIRNASELLDQTEFFVYEDGFGKGSPSAFSNLFRYALLVERGGWWVDTDVLCLSDKIPPFDEFFARQDSEFVNGAVLYFPPQHSVMRACLKQARRMGRSIRWGDTGPRLLTQMLAEFGLCVRARDASLCYPVHYTRALDLLRASKTALVEAQVASALFLHLWNEMLAYGGIRKDLLPPAGSWLRRWVEAHPVEGWTGQYG